MKQVLLSLCLLLTTVFCCACTPIVGGNTSATTTETPVTTTTTAQSTKTMTMVFMPSPPKCKTTTDESIIKQVTERIVQMEKTPLNQDEARGGWTAKVDFPDGTALTFSPGATWINWNGVEYTVSEADTNSLYTDLKAIYDQLDAEEYLYGKK